MAVRLQAVAVTTAVAAAITAVVIWKDSLRDHTNNNRESAKNDAFSRFCFLPMVHHFRSPKQIILLSDK
jgi:hypothetical protein